MFCKTVNSKVLLKTAGVLQYCIIVMIVYTVELETDGFWSDFHKERAISHPMHLIPDEWHSSKATMCEKLKM